MSVHPLHGNQALAVAPEDSVWLSASAGTGKTQVLSSRVLRLLLQPDVDPSQILCLTFTKAGATEMAARINEILATWVRLPNTELAKRLSAIGASPDPATRDRARTLFANGFQPGTGRQLRLRNIEGKARLQASWLRVFWCSIIHQLELMLLFGGENEQICAEVEFSGYPVDSYGNPLLSSAHGSRPGVQNRHGRDPRGSPGKAGNRGR